MCCCWTGSAPPPGPFRDGSPVLPADRFRLSVLSSADGPADLAVRTDVDDGFALEELARAVHAAHPVHRVAAMSRAAAGTRRSAAAVAGHGR